MIGASEGEPSPRRGPRPAGLRALCLLLLVASACSDPPALEGDGGVVEDAGAPAFVEETRITPPTSVALGQVANGPVAFDYDGDGDVDLLVLGGYGSEGRVGGIALLRNDGSGAFVDVAAESGLLAQRIYSLGAAFDYDNDGDQDLYLCASESFPDGVRSYDGPDVLYRNDGDGSFTDVTAAAGIVESATTFTVAAADVDGDGFLDLYVPQHTDSDLFGAALANPSGASPNLQGDPDLLFHNGGDGTFVEESAARGVGAGNPSLGIARRIDDAGLAALFIDYDVDGDADLLVANDGGYVIAYQNSGGTFTDVSVPAGTKALGWGAWMGFSPTDLDGDGAFEIIVDNEGTSWLAYPESSVEPGDFMPLAVALHYQADGAFVDVAPTTVVEAVPPMPFVRADLAPPVAGSLQELPFGWAISALDVDNDGLEDLYQTGSLAFTSTQGIVATYEQGGYPGILLQRRAVAGRFRDVTVTAGVADTATDGTFLPHWGHTFADLQGDGYLELIVGNQAMPDRPGALRIFRNLGGARHWLDVRLRGTASNRDGIGALVTLQASAGGPVQVRSRFVTGWSYPSGPLHFGLGTATTVARVEVRWPSGRTQVVTDLAADTVVTLEEP